MNICLKLMLVFAVCLFFLVPISAQYNTGSIKGVIKDKNSKEPLIGAAALIRNTSIGAIADFDGNFEISGLKPGVYEVVFSYVAYQPKVIANVVVEPQKNKELEVEMVEDKIMLEAATVSAQLRGNTELSAIAGIKTSNVVVNAISAQQIKKTQDRDASEVIKRVPGISIIDNKFVVIRGLSQRYNNVWINNCAVPSSEADTRAFSFDIIPSSQIDNVTIIKVPTPEYPADFAGGFISIKTKDIPSKNSFSVSLSTGLNDESLSHDFKKAQGSSTDFLAFDNGFRGLKNNVPSRLTNSNSLQVIDVTQNGFNNSWQIKSISPLPDFRFGMTANHFWNIKKNKKLGLLASLNYSNANRSYIDMENSRYSIWNVTEDKSVYVNKYSDNQYSVDSKLGSMLNFSYAPSSRCKYEFRNLFNQLGREKYTQRDGYQNISGMYVQQKREYLYSSRTSYSGQFSNTYNAFDYGTFDWSVGYSYANKNQPDRRIINMEEYVGEIGDPNNGKLQIEPNDVSRDFSYLNENIYSTTFNYKKDFSLGKVQFDLKTGFYGEYKNRDYNTRLFLYRWNTNDLPSNFNFLSPFDGVLNPQYYDHGQVYVYEETDNRNNYEGTNTLLAGYIGTNIQYYKMNLYGGVRYEKNTMSLTSYTSISSDRTKTIDYPLSDFFPSATLTYKLSDKHQLRFAYGSSINRQEFREISSSVYYDFDLFSDVKGNPSLKPAYIQNLDFRYEIYPSAGELISIAIFTKNFKNPIEWTYLDAGGSYTYTFENAKSANNLGAELEIKKSLSFLRMPNFTFTFNGALIKSEVEFEDGSLEENRPMQGQSPYIINGGLFYMLEKSQMQIGVLYNRIGKRIVGIGRSDAGENPDINNSIPNTYEMPRNSLDLTFSKKIQKHIELRASVRDVFAESVKFVQHPKFRDQNNSIKTREQITKEYNTGRTFSMSLNINF